MYAIDADVDDDDAERGCVYRSWHGCYAYAKKGVVWGDEEARNEADELVGDGRCACDAHNCVFARGCQGVGGDEHRSARTGNTTTGVIRLTYAHYPHMPPFDSTRHYAPSPFLRLLAIKLSILLAFLSSRCCCGHIASRVLCPPRWMTRRETCPVAAGPFFPLHTAQPQNAHGSPWTAFCHMNILWDDSS